MRPPELSTRASFIHRRCFSLYTAFHPGSNPGLPHCRQILYCLSRQESPRILEWVACPVSRGSSQPRNQTGVSCIVGGFFTSWVTSSVQLLSRVRLFGTPGLQHTQLPCPSSIPRAYSNSCPSSRWCHPGWLVRNKGGRARGKAIPPFLRSRPKQATNQSATSVLENPEHLPSKESESEVTQLGPTLYDPMDCSLPGSSIHGIFQAGVLEWVAMSLSRGSSQGSKLGLQHCRQMLYHLSHCSKHSNRDFKTLFNSPLQWQFLVLKEGSSWIYKPV